MTSGMSAKGSALGAGGSEGGVAMNRAPLPRAPGNGTKRSRESRPARTSRRPGSPKPRRPRPEASVEAAAESSHPAMSSSVRTLILGIDYDGRIVQHDRNAAKILARKPEDLLGAQLIELTSAGPTQTAPRGTAAQANSHAARQADGAAAVAGLLEAIRSDREGSAMLTIDTRDGTPAEAVVTVHPMRAGGHQPGRARPAPHPRAQFRAVRRSRAHAQADARRHVHQDRRHARHRSPGPRADGRARAALLQRGRPAAAGKPGRRRRAARARARRVAAAAPDRAAPRPEGSRLGGGLPHRRDPALPDRTRRTSGAWTPARRCSRRPSARARRARSPRPGGASRWPSCCRAPPC